MTITRGITHLIQDPPVLPAAFELGLTIKGRD